MADDETAPARRSQGPGHGGPARGPGRGSYRPPFGPGNTVSRTHGATSPRTVGPVAAEIERAARADQSWPHYLTDPSFGAAVAAWAWAEATVSVLRTYLAERDVGEAMTDRDESETITEQVGETTSRRRTTGQRTRSALDHLARAEIAAAGRRAALGLDPLSRARLGRDVTAAAVDGAELLTRLREAAERGPDGASGSTS